MRKAIFILVYFVSLTGLSGQDLSEPNSGQISFVTSGNIYVKFRTTSGITPGDTLFSRANGSLLPVLIVNSLSTTSCVCTPVISAKLSIADIVVTKPSQPANNSSQKKSADSAVKPGKVTAAEDTIGKVTRQIPYRQKISGSLSASSYSDFSNTPAQNSQRFRYTLSLKAQNIANSRFSFETYTSFRHKTGNWQEVQSNIFSALKIYNLALVYAAGKTTSVSVGRRINQHLSNLGASDGIQIDQGIGKFSVGAVAGFRPDYSDYGFNSNLKQFGAYLGLNTRNQKGSGETSIAFMQQMNGSNIDRRFLYFQHSNSLIQNLYILTTLEADLYKLAVDTATNTQKSSNIPEITGMYISLRYKLSDRLSVSGSYDARKNVIYYETYRNFLDRILEEQMRQGYRLQLNYRITRYLSFGLQGGYRYLKSDPHPTRNAYGYLTYSNIPGINVSVTLSGTYLESAFVNSKIYGATLTRDMLDGRLETSLGYRYADYSMPESLTSEIQHIGEANLFWLIGGRVSLGINYEGTYEQVDRYHRIYITLRTKL